MENEAFLVPGLGARLKKLREKSGLTQEEVADRMGIVGEGRRTMVSGLELDRCSNPTIRVLTNFLRAVGARWPDIADLLDRTEVPPPRAEQVRRAVEALRPTQPTVMTPELRAQLAPRKPMTKADKTGAIEDCRLKIEDCRLPGEEGQPPGPIQGPPELRPRAPMVMTPELKAQLAPGKLAVLPRSNAAQGPIELRPKKSVVMTPELRALLFPNRNAAKELLEKTKEEAAEYQRGIAAPREGAPLPPPMQPKVVSNYQDWRFQSSIIRRKVLDFLCTTQLTVPFYERYQIFGQKVLGGLRRAGKIKQLELQETCRQREIDKAYAFAKKQWMDTAICDQVKEVVVAAYATLTKS